MRYLGSKESLLPILKEFLLEHNLLNRTRKLHLFDAFCGMGSVSSGLKTDYNLIINDLLSCSVAFTEARLLSGTCKFESLGYSPFDFFNNSLETRKGFIYNNYTPGGSERMYFSAENGGRIDFFRHTIKSWHKEGKITDKENIYLLGCLLESVSSVSNTAGVYGAYLKHWDSRALKPIVFQEINDSPSGNVASYKVYNDKIEDIIGEVECDILYLDPPYTQNQYGTQYHLLETLVLDDAPTISKVTGSRPTGPMRSDWSKEYLSNILFDKIVAETKAKYIIFSYNNDGFMSKDYIESTLKRYGKEETLCCKTIDYKKYNNTKCQGKEGHCEYLFFIEKKDKSELIYESPLNYQGSKSKMIPVIKKELPASYDCFIDAFGGGFNVGINMPCKNVVYNDINTFVYGLIKSFGDEDTKNYLMYIARFIKQYNLSTSNKDGYLRFREKYNSLPEGKRDPKMLYTLLLFGFQQQIRFNTNHEFNNPFGSRYFNDRLMSKFIAYARVAKSREIIYCSEDYKEMARFLTKSSIMYLDPPYRDSAGTYNDGKRGFAGWSKKQEQELCTYLDAMNRSNFRFLLSYNDNRDIIEWAQTNQYKVIYIEQTQGRYNKRREILVKNF